jgi:transcriptional regulator with XRE-family HTH domain
MAERHTWVELRIMRQRDGHSLTSLAEETTNPRTGKPISLSYLSQLESGDREPNAVVIKALATALRCPVSMLEKRHQPGQADVA